MNIFKLFKGTATSWTGSYYDNKSFNIYYTSRQAIKAYTSWTGIVQKRQIANDVIEALETLVNHQFSQEEIDYINSNLLKNNSTLENVNRTNTFELLNLLKSIDSSGVSLLNIDEDIDLDKLKKLYKTASKKHHPDLGGDLEVMKKVNEVFSLFYEAICSYVPRGFEEHESTPLILTSFQELIFSAHLLLAVCYADFFAADKALYNLEKAYSMALKETGNYIGKFSLMLAQDGITKICKVLCAFKMKEEHIVASSMTRYIYKRMPADMFNNLAVPFISYDEEAKIVIKHIEQARNAFRLGKIDSGRYEKALKKFEDIISEGDSKLETVKKFASVTGFYRDSKLSAAVSNAKIVSAPSYYLTRFCHLEDDQKWEYLNCFHELEFKYFFKYYRIRTQELLYKMILSFDDFNDDKILKELGFFSSNLSAECPEYKLVEELFIYFSSCSNDERHKKLQVLASMDDPDPIDFNISITINIFDINPKRDYKKRISVNRDYLQFAMSTIEEINVFNRTGVINNEFSRAYHEDLESLNKFQKTKIAQDRNHIWLKTVNKPEKVIETSELYLNGLLELGKIFHPKNVGELQIGYEIDRITIAYAKLKKWDRVMYWGDILFGLDVEYRNRSSKSDLEKIKKRIERARSSITKL